MRIRRGWQATVGELAAVLCHLDVAQGADAYVRDGQLWIRHPQAAVGDCGADPGRARRACPPLGSDLRRRGHRGHSPCDSLDRIALAQS